jgi:hypothetical protein
MARDNECCNCEGDIYLFGGAWVHRKNDSMQCDPTKAKLDKDHVAIPRYHEPHNQMILQFS